MKSTGVPAEPNDGADVDGPEYGASDCDGRDDFERFCEWHRPRLEQWYRRFGLSAEDAADVAQEALAGLSRRWPRLTTEEHRRRSFYTITRNKLTDFFRKRERRVQPEVSLDDDSQADLVADEQTTNPDVMLAGPDAHPVWTAVEELPEARRDAVVGRVVHRMSYDELADATGRTQPALRQDVARALAFLRRALKTGHCVLVAWVTKARRVKDESAKTALASASATALAVIPQGAFLSLLVTAPLYVLPARNALADAATELPRVVIASLPQPIHDGVIGLVVPGSSARPRGQLARPRLGVVNRILRQPAPTNVTVDPRDVCLKNRCGTGDRITVRILGHEQALPGQSLVDVCWAVPAQAEPYVTCSEGTEAS